MQKNNFDLLRLLAAFQVLFSHTSAHLFSEYGYIFSNTVLLFQKIIHYFPGVPVFFLISGFLIAMSYQNNSDLKDYIKNRILRIYPALYINIFLGVLILYLFGYVTFNREFFLWLIAQMSIIQFYNAEMFRSFGVGVINGSLWTISVELCFYIALPILFLIYKKSKLLIGFIFIISFSLWVYDLTSTKEIFYNKFLHSTIFPYFFLFLFGMGFYKFYDRLVRYLENKFLWWLLIYPSFILIAEFLNIATNPLIQLFQWIIFSFFIFSFAYSFKELSNRLLRGNDYTYGVYIYHMLIINIFVHLNLTGKIEYFWFVVLLSLISGVLSWHFIERPFLKLKKHSLFHSMHR